jgi:hypothetical protein
LSILQAFRLSRNLPASLKTPVFRPLLGQFLTHASAILWSRL